MPAARSETGSAGTRGRLGTTTSAGSLPPGSDRDRRSRGARDSPVGFGDILPGSGATQALSVLEALSGLGLLGLVIGCLPTLNAAYQSRECQLLLLDDLTDTRITPMSLLASHIGPDGDTTSLDETFREWERWCAEVFESHSSLPMLVLWRSKHRGQSWVTPLGVVTDAAIDHIATVPGADRGPAMRLYRQSVRLITFLAERTGLEPDPYERLPSRYWSIGYSAISRLGCATVPFEESLGRLHDLREPFHPLMEAFIDELLAPRGFWGVTAADHLAPTSLGEIFGEDADDLPPTPS